MSNLNKHLKRHYESKSLSQTRLDALLTEGQEKRHMRWWRILPAVAATLVIIGFSVFNHYQNQSQLHQRVIAEIAMNHSKELNIEIATSQYDDLQVKLDRIDFPIYSDTIPRNHQLLGGRYCSIQGELAAQLKLQNQKTGDVKTLYVTRLTDKLKTLPSQTTTQNNITIQLWQTNNRLFGLASTTQTTY